ncbi:hypothetical protein HaLaN_07375, partial [Haematococcus lacustris]
QAWAGRRHLQDNKTLEAGGCLLTHSNPEHSEPRLLVPACQAYTTLWTANPWTVRIVPLSTACCSAEGRRSDTLPGSAEGPGPRPPHAAHAWLPSHGAPPRPEGSRAACVL